MLRKSAWVVSATLLTGACVQAQGPAPVPYGIPAYQPGVQTPYADPRMMPRPYNTSPFANPYPTAMPAQPGPDPSMIPAPPNADRSMIPSISGAPMPPSLNVPRNPYSPAGPFTGYAPSPTPAEPYLVAPEPVMQAPMAAPPMAIAPQPVYGPPPMAAPISGPGEPYVLYEGQRSLAEVRQEGVAVWVQTNYLHWWTRRDAAPPLVTTGNSANPAVGTLGQPDTVVLLGGQPIAASEFSGFQTNVGVWLDDQHLNSVQFSGFWLGQRGNSYSIGTNANGSPPIAQPIVVNGAEQAAVLGQVGEFAGRINFNTETQLFGAEINLSSNVCRLCGWSFDWFTGFRYLNLSDSLSDNQKISVLPGGGFVIPFNGIPQPPGSVFLINDSFNVGNQFYGGQFGGHLNWTCWKLDFDAIVKCGLGATTHTVVIDGATSVNGASLPGGILAQPSNMGHFYKTDFSVVPEFTWTMGYQITPHIRLMAGYTFLYWNQVMRAAGQVDRTIDVAQAPSLAFGPVTPAVRPAFPAARTDFWAQGVNLGLEFRY